MARARVVSSSSLCALKRPIHPIHPVYPHLATAEMKMGTDERSPVKAVQWRAVEAKGAKGGRPNLSAPSSRAFRSRAHEVRSIRTRYFEHEGGKIKVICQICHSREPLRIAAGSGDGGECRGSKLKGDASERVAFMRTPRRPLSFSRLSNRAYIL